MFPRAARQRFTFASHHGALAIAVRDLDHDGDPDLVVSSLSTHEVAAVWLNDGIGRFERADLRESPATLPPLAGMTAAVAGAALKPKRIGDIGQIAGLFVRAPVTPATPTPDRAPGFTIPGSITVRGLRFFFPETFTPTSRRPFVAFAEPAGRRPACGASSNDGVAALPTRKSAICSLSD